MLTSENQRTTDESSSSSFSQSLQSVGVLGVVAILLRWSWLTIPLIALSLYLAVSQTSEIDPEYTAEASVLLTGPSEVFVEDFETSEVYVEEVNPLQALGGSLATVANVMAIAMSDPDILDQLESEGLSTSVEVGVQSRSPIMVIQVVDDDAELVAATADRMIDIIAEDLDSRQDALDAPETDRIRSQAIAGSVVGPPDYGGRNRVRLVIAVVGTALAVALAFVLEAIRQLIRRRRLAKLVVTPDRAVEQPDVGLAHSESSDPVQPEPQGDRLGRSGLGPSVLFGVTGSGKTGTPAPIVGPVGDRSDGGEGGGEGDVPARARTTGGDNAVEQQVDIHGDGPTAPEGEPAVGRVDHLETESLRVVDYSLEEMIQNLDSSNSFVSDTASTIEIPAEDLARYRNGGGANGNGS